MPELTVIHFGLFGLMLVLGVVSGWFSRASRCVKEKLAISASWRDQLESQQSEHDRLAGQNKSLMEQISQYQASQKDFTNRAKELSDSLKEAFARRDELQRQLKDVRGNLEVAIAQRDRLNDKLQSQGFQGQPSAMKEKDDKIFHLSRELTSWQSRVPPLVERYQERDQQARAVEEELEQTKARLQALEDQVRSDQTRIEPVDADSLPDGGHASNEPIAMTSDHDTSEIQDQINDTDDDSVDEAPEDSTNEETAFAAVFSNEGNADAEEEEVEIDEGSDDVMAEIEGASDDQSAEDAPAEENNDFHADDNNDGEDIDDLKSIKGIGPSIEKTLHELGITRFHQIAEMSEHEIDRVAQKLRGFRSRIYREDWIGQARDFQAQKNGDSS